MMHFDLGRSIHGLGLAALLALGCDGSPGASRMQVLTAATAEPVWAQTLPTQEFWLEEGAPEGVLRVFGSDYCWDANTIIELDRDTGAKLGEREPQPSAQTGGYMGEVLDPPTGCAQPFVRERVTLSNGELIDLCAFSVDSRELLVTTVATRSERFRVTTDSTVELHVFDDYLVVSTIHEPARVEAFSLDSGENLWSWTASAPYTYVRAGDAERVYIWEETSLETYALSFADGTVVWQRNLGCEWLSLDAELLICGARLRDSTCSHD